MGGIFSSLFGGGGGGEPPEKPPSAPPAGLSKSAKRRAQKKRASARKAAAEPSAPSMSHDSPASMGRRGSSASSVPSEMEDRPSPASSRRASVSSDNGAGAAAAAAPAPKRGSASAEDDGAGAWRTHTKPKKKSAAERQAARDARATEQAGRLAPHSAETQAWLTRPAQDGTRNLYGQGSAGAHDAEQAAKDSYLTGNPDAAIDHLDRAYRDRVRENKRLGSKKPDTDHGAGYVRDRRNSLDRVTRGDA